MLRNEYFLKAMASGAYKHKNWVVSAFALTHEAPDVWKTKPYQYRLVVMNGATYFVEMVNGMEPVLVRIEDAPVGERLFAFLDPIELEPYNVPNLKEKITSTIGNVFFNWCCLVEAFGDKVPYLNGEVNTGKLEDYFAARIQDSPETEAQRKPDTLYVDEFIRFQDNLYHMTNYSQLCVWAATEKSMVAPPGINEYRAKLLEENKDRLHDPAVIAAIDAKLVEYDANYLKGDPSENFLLSGKSRGIVRKKLFLMHGAETGIEEGVDVTLIKNSLSEGWDITAFPAMNDSLRAGSFNRGAQTELGGESVKWLLRASSNIAITEEDCGSKLGIPYLVTKKNMRKLVNRTVIDGEAQTLVSDINEAGSYLGKHVMVRSPLNCQLDKTDYCKVCLGSRLSVNPTGLSLAVSECGSAFLDMFMSAAHAKALQLAKMDYTTAFN
jgi:hypothetical protein